MVIDTGMNWTTQKPLTSGWYGWRTMFSSLSTVVHVNVETGTVISLGTDEHRLLREIVDGEWFGPLEMPQ